MTDEYVNISSRTWNRIVDPINKVGYSDGVTDGQAAIFQTCFDTGYEQGLQFGFKLGVMDARSQIGNLQEKGHLGDQRRINCQICLNNSTDGNTMNLFNLQKEKNDEYLQSMRA